jgi:hypothetical protein
VDSLGVENLKSLFWLENIIFRVFKEIVFWKKSGDLLPETNNL